MPRLLLLLALLCPMQFSAMAAHIPDAIDSFDERAERDYKPKYLDLAWGDFNERHVRTQAAIWPVNVLSIGHTIASYQNYGDGQPYFHHGLDIRADAGSDVKAAVGGKVINIENYMGGAAYWEIAILDDDGFIWQYHHVNHESIPSEITDAFRTGNPIIAGTKLGEVYYWDVVSFGERYNHIHLNVLGKNKQYLNGFSFLPALNDQSGPQIVDIGVLQNGRRIPGNSVSGTYSVYAQINDLILSKVFIVPPNTITIQVDGADPLIMWQFDSLPGGASKDQYVDQFYVPSMACGDYQCRRPVIDLGFNTAGLQRFPQTRGTHQIHVVASDFVGNTTSRDFSWTVQ